MNLSRGEILSLLQCRDPRPLFARADRVRREQVGDEILLRALLEFSSYCRRQCRYCGLNCTNRSLERFRLSPDDIVSAAWEAQAAGYRTIVLQSGEDPWFTPEVLCDIVRRIKPCGIAVTLSCGEFPAEGYRRFREAGADRYLLKHETSDPRLYARLHPDSTFEERVRCLYDIKAAGMETGGGFMIGLPGQTPETVADDLLLLASIPCDMAGIGPFLPHPATVLCDAPPGSADLTRRAVAIARILLPRANLPATTALQVLEPDRADSVLSCGANVIMQKITPSRVKRLYEIYPSHLADTDIRADRERLEARLRRIGRIPV